MSSIAVKKIVFVVIPLLLMFLLSAFKMVPPTLKEFESLEQAKSWISKHELPVVLIANEYGTINLDSATHDPRYDCDDYARDLEDLALNDGYKITQVPVINGYVLGVYVTPIPGLHIGNWTRINDVFYYIESSPSTTRWNIVKIRNAD